MPTIIAKIDHRTESNLAILRMPDGTLIAGDAEVSELDAEDGDVVILGDGWETGTEKDWEPQQDVGVVEHVNNSVAIIRGNRGLIVRTIPDGQAVETGNSVLFDARPVLLDVVAKRPTQISPLDNEFDVDSVRSSPNKELNWQDFSGFPDLVREAQDIVAVHTRSESRKELVGLGVPPVRGILFEGPPGTGKTYLAQIMAAQSGATFYLVTTASLGGRLVSESEQRLEAIYADAASKEMSIVFVDEIEVLTRERGSEQDHSSRLVNVFLTNMDGVNSADNVITIGTTNRVGDIDRALRRPGRFDREVTFRHPDLADRLAILSARPYSTAGDIDYQAVANETAGWTAAELGAIWQHAGELTVIADRNSIHNDHFLVGFERARTARDNRLNGK
ncbi:ATP-binding protein [Brachybacterium tyrofermentans]|uniref:ATP-binding protein n=1 Tax=Brachybacterium tyrofermentans TaxID=47848 RepID=UPI003FCF3135